MSQPDLEEQVRIKNRKKLINQNIKMYAQLKHLQAEIDRWDEQQGSRPEDVNLIPLKAQIEAQEKEIRLLKEQVEAGRQGNLKENVIYIRKEENQLLFLKKELEKCQQERDLMHQGHQDKVKKLATNEPLIKHKEEIQNLWADTKKQNRQNNLKIVELEREIRKFHSLKERAKDKDNTSNEIKELQHIESEIVRMNAEIKTKQLKWKPNIEVLDNEFFTHKNTLQIMNKKLEELEKDEGVWKMRAAALRDQKEIEEDRDRLSKVVAMVKPEPPKKEDTSNKFNQKEADLAKRVEAVHKQVRNLNKNDKFVELVRVQSSPNPTQSLKKNVELNSARKSIDLMPAQKSIKLNPIPLSPSLKGKKTEPITLPLEKQSSNKKDKLIDISLSARGSIKNEEVIEINKNGSNWAGRRDKQRIKSTIASNLAEKIKQKAEEVKKINQNMEKQKVKDPRTAGKLEKSKSKEMERSVSSPKKNRDTDKLKLRVQTDSQVLLKPIQRQKSGSKLQGQMPSPKNKDKKDSSLIKSTEPNKQSIKSKLIDVQSKDNVKKANISAQKSPKNKHKELVQRIDIKNKQKQASIERKNDKKPIMKHKNAEADTVVHVVKPQSKSKPERLPSPKQRPQIKPKIDIFMNDLPRQMIPRKPNTNEVQRQTQEEPDQMQGVPKRIIRKKVAEGGQVTTGTST